MMRRIKRDSQIKVITVRKNIEYNENGLVILIIYFIVDDKIKM